MHTKSPHNIDLSESPMNEEQKSELVKTLKQVDEPASDEINFLVLSIQEGSSKEIILKVLVRNGTQGNIEIKQLSIQVLKDDKEVVTQGTFPMENLIVNSNSSKPTQFIFPPESVLIKNSDLSKCSIHVIAPLKN